MPASTQFMTGPDDDYAAVAVRRQGRIVRRNLGMIFQERMVFSRSASHALRAVLASISIQHTPDHTCLDVLGFTCRKLPLSLADVIDGAAFGHCWRFE